MQADRLGCQLHSCCWVVVTLKAALAPEPPPMTLCAGARESEEQVAPIPPEHAGDAEEGNVKPAHSWRAHHEAGGGVVSGGLPQLPSHRD